MSQIQARWSLVVLLGMFCAIALFMNSAVYAGAPEKPGRPVKLAAPANIVCVKAGDMLTVTWDQVPDAAGYRVMVDADEDQGLARNVVEPRYTLAPSVLTDDPTTPMDVKVKAIDTRARRYDSKPSAEVSCLAPEVIHHTPTQQKTP